MSRFRTTLALGAVLAAVPAPTSAAESFAHWAFDNTGACLGALSGDSVDWDDGSRCLGDRLVGFVVEEAARFLTERGRATFGEHFGPEYAANRNRNTTGNRNNHVGFRVAGTARPPGSPRPRMRGARYGPSRAGHDERTAPRSGMMAVQGGPALSL